MGCGSSINQVHDTGHKKKKSQNLDLQQKFNIQKQWNEPYSLGKCYFFGQTSVQKKVVSYDVAHHNFQTISSRVRIPVPKIKLQPIEIFYQQSQQVILPDLFNQLPKPPFNQMFGTFFNCDVIFLCGGVTYQRDEVSSEAYFYRIKIQKSSKQQDKNVMNKYTKFQKTQSMITARYRHMGVFKMRQKDGFIYVFGGLNQKGQVLQSCQKFNINQKKWVQLPPMLIPRSQGFVFIFMNKIYVLGGISNQNYHPKMIEVLDPLDDTWIQLQIKLHRGIRSGILITPNPNQILVLGGRDNESEHKSVIRFNLLKQTYVWQAQSTAKLSNCKAAIDKDRVIVFGVGKQNSIYEYNTQSKKWSAMNYGYKSYIPVPDIEKFACISEPLKVSLEQLKAEQELDYSLQKNQTYLFGNENYPFICKLTYCQNTHQFKFNIKQVPMSVRLVSMMTAVQTQDQIMLLGGTYQNKKKGLSQFFSYKQKLQTSNELNKFHVGRYNFSAKFINDRIYIIGGINDPLQRFNANKAEHQSQMIQIYDIKSKQWTRGPKLCKLAADPQTFVFGPQNNQKILIFNSKQISNSRSQIVQIYDIGNSLVSAGQLQCFTFQQHLQYLIEQIQYNPNQYIKTNQKQQSNQNVAQSKIKQQNADKQQQLNQQQTLIKVIPLLTVDNMETINDVNLPDQQKQSSDIIIDNAVNKDVDEQFEYVMVDKKQEKNNVNIVEHNGDKLNAQIMTDINSDQYYCLRMNIFVGITDRQSNMIDTVKILDLLINKADYSMNIKEPCFEEQYQKLNIEIRDYQHYFTLPGNVHCFMGEKQVYVVRKNDSKQKEWVVQKLQLNYIKQGVTANEFQFRDIKNMPVFTILSRK